MKKFFLAVSMLFGLANADCGCGAPKEEKKVIVEAMPSCNSCNDTMVYSHYNHYNHYNYPYHYSYYNHPISCGTYVDGKVITCGKDSCGRCKKYVKYCMSGFKYDECRGTCKPVCDPCNSCAA